MKYSFKHYCEAIDNSGLNPNYFLVVLTDEELKSIYDEFFLPGGRVDGRRMLIVISRMLNEKNNKLADSLREKLADLKAIPAVIYNKIKEHVQGGNRKYTKLYPKSNFKKPGRSLRERLELIKAWEDGKNLTFVGLILMNIAAISGERTSDLGRMSMRQSVGGKVVWDSPYHTTTNFKRLRGTFGSLGGDEKSYYSKHDVETALTNANDRVRQDIAGSDKNPYDCGLTMLELNHLLSLMDSSEFDRWYSGITDLRATMSDVDIRSNKLSKQPGKITDGIINKMAPVKNN